MMSRIKSFKAEVLSIEFHETHIFFFQRTLQEFWREQKALNERMIALSKLLDTCLLLCIRNCVFQVMSTYWFSVICTTLRGYSCTRNTSSKSLEFFSLRRFGFSPDTTVFIHSYKRDMAEVLRREKKKMTPKKKGMQAKKCSLQKCHLERCRLPLMPQHTTTKL